MVEIELLKELRKKEEKIKVVQNMNQKGKKIILEQISEMILFLLKDLNYQDLKDIKKIQEILNHIMN